MKSISDLVMENSNISTKQITINVDEYKELLESQLRLKMFIDFVKSESYIIGRKECARYLGFKLPEEGDTTEPSAETT